MNQPTQITEVLPPTGAIALKSLLVGLLFRNTRLPDVVEIEDIVKKFMKDHPEIQIVERK
jgi:hypothetical protein